MPDLLNTIDISQYLSGSATPEQARELAQNLVRESARVGFFYVKGWEKLVPKDLVAEVFDYNKRFFDLPLEIKNSLAYTSSKANRGYLSFGREQASLSTQVTLNGGEVITKEPEKDQKETMEIGNDIDPDYPEHWPKEEDLPGFRSTMNRFHLACHELHLEIMSLLAISLDLDRDYFVPSISGRSHCLRLLHYPPTNRKEGQTRIGSHTDFGTVTLLWQDETGGLEVVGPDGQWCSVEPKPDTFVINIGDILSRWSNDKLKSTIHRAILPDPSKDDPVTGKTRTRRSVAYFCNPDPTATIACIPGLEGPNGPKYKPILSGDYYAQALEAEIGV
ncbi:isopenicillin N synthase family dioxygenase [Sporobolomyces salmoneus]|uniref:isopenicillin N synthase family dioxygenase n=1 Tax=Sporobolomyces salmoneus TaxID=183962 RepID=UPI0031758EB8